MANYSKDVKELKRKTLEHRFWFWQYHRHVWTFLPMMSPVTPHTWFFLSLITYWHVQRSSWRRFGVQILHISRPHSHRYVQNCTQIKSFGTVFQECKYSQHTCLAHMYTVPPPTHTHRKTPREDAIAKETLRRSTRSKKTKSHNPPARKQSSSRESVSSGSSLSSGASVSSSCHSGSAALAAQLSQLLDVQKKQNDVLLTLQRASSTNVLSTTMKVPRQPAPPTTNKRARDKKTQKREKKLKKKLKKRSKRMKSDDNVSLYPHYTGSFVPPPPPRAVRRAPPRRMGYQWPRQPFMWSHELQRHSQPPVPHTPLSHSHSLHQPSGYVYDYMAEYY